MTTGMILDPWEVSESGFPADGRTADKLAYALNYAVLAPSGHNTQPWLFQVKKDHVDLFADRTQALPVVDPSDRELIISCGAALFNLRAALRYFGYTADTEVLPDPKRADLLARIMLGHSYKATADEAALFQAITKRRTNRSAYENRPLPEPLLEALKMAATQEGAWLEVIENEDIRNAAADLIAEGDRIQWSDAQFRRELASWTHPNRNLRRDGIPGYAMGIADTATYAGPLILRTFDLGNGQAAKDRDLALGSPALVVLGTEKDDTAAWLATGQALQRILLRARASNVWASYLNQPIEVPELRSRFARVVGHVGHPQLCLRLGYGPEVRPTPRRHVSDVVIESWG